MPDFMVRNISKETYAALRRDARRHGRSINAEVVAALDEKAAEARRRADRSKAMREIDRLREEIARAFPTQPDSVDMIREDRDSR